MTRIVLVIGQTFHIKYSTVSIATRSNKTRLSLEFKQSSVVLLVIIFDAGVIKVVKKISSVFN